MFNVTDGDAFDVLFQALAQGALEGLELFVDQDVEDDALKVGFKAPFGEVHEGQFGGANSRGTQTHGVKRRPQSTAKRSRMSSSGV